MEMGGLDHVEPQGPGNRVNGLPGWANRTALFQPDVPVNGNVCELGHFVTTKPRGAAPTSLRQAECFRPDRLTPGAEEAAKFVAGMARRGGRGLHLRVGLFYPTIILVLFVA